MSDEEIRNKNCTKVIKLQKSKYINLYIPFYLQW